MKIGVFGGCFNPFHRGHLSIVKEIFFKIKMDKIIFIPNTNPYYKESYPVPFDYIKSMIDLSLDKEINYEISSLESEPGMNYSSFETLSALLKDKIDDFYLILGSDQFIEFHKWKNYADIMNLVNIVVGIREPYSLDIEKIALTNYCKEVCCEDNIRIFELQSKKKLIIYDLLDKYDISSSNIHKMLSLGKIEEARQFLLPEVLDFILSKGLYK